MKLLDLFCGAGGASVGYQRAGFTEIVGVDIEPQKNYPFKFILADALDFSLEGFDAVHASPPCQKWVTIASNTDKGRSDVNLVYPTRLKLQEANVPYVIENVPGSPLKSPLVLCGTMFEDLRVLRHRHFESNISLPQPDLSNCEFHPPVYTRDKRSRSFGKFDPMKDYVSVFGNSSCSKEAAASAMCIDWMNKYELTQAIPPHYTEFIGKYLIEYINSKKEA